VIHVAKESEPPISNGSHSMLLTPFGSRITNFPFISPLPKLITSTQLYTPCLNMAEHFSGGEFQNVAQSVLRWATGWTIGVLGFDFRRGLGILLFTTASRKSLGPTEPPIQWVPGALSLMVERPRREADRSPPPSAEVKE
jgi:hypothetical protein